MEREIIVTIDPKLIGSGFAVASSRRLLHVGIARVPATMRDLEGRIERQIEIIREHIPTGDGRPDTVVGEFPAIYPNPDQGLRRRGAGGAVHKYREIDPNDLVRLAGLVCGIAAGLRPQRLLLPLPRQWKGTIPKAVHHARLAEQHPRAVTMVQAIRSKELRLDAWDAVGLWSWYLETCAVGGDE